MKKIDAIPLTLYDVIRGDMEHKKRLRFALSLPTMDPKLKLAIEDERDQREREAEAKEVKLSATNSDNAKAQRKAVSREDLERLRCEYMLIMQRDHDWPEGRDHGWKEYALGENRLPVRITRKTLDARWKEK